MNVDYQGVIALGIAAAIGLAIWAVRAIRERRTTTATPEYDSWAVRGVCIEADELTDDEARVVALIGKSVLRRRQAVADAEAWAHEQEGLA